jgi:hypothetical protein
MRKQPNDVIAKNSDDLNYLFAIYQLVFEKHNQEGDGIWNRFNVMIGINVAMLGVFAFIYSSNARPIHWRELGIGICIVGLSVCFWSLYVLKNLWLWHEHWRDKCRLIEANFPSYAPWVRPHTEIHEKKLVVSISMVRRSITAYTQPFLLIFSLLWIAIIVLLFIRWL